MHRYPSCLPLLPSAYVFTRLVLVIFLPHTLEKISHQTSLHLLAFQLYSANSMYSTNKPPYFPPFLLDSSETAFKPSCNSLFPCKNPVCNSFIKPRFYHRHQNAVEIQKNVYHTRITISGFNRFITPYIVLNTIQHIILVYCPASTAPHDPIVSS